MRQLNDTPTPAHGPLLLFFFLTVTTAICTALSRTRSKATDGELIGAEECSCADCRTVKVLNQKRCLSC